MSKQSSSDNELEKPTGEKKEEYPESKVIKLPKIGEALSVATIKQGRKANMGAYKMNLQVRDGMIGKKLVSGERLDHMEKYEFAKLSVVNICKHRYATQKQKEAVHIALDSMTRIIDRSMSVKLEAKEWYQFTTAHAFIRRLTMSFNRHGGLKT